jgi:predicted porin
MKKTLVALAALASVSAFAQVTISGGFDAGLRMSDLKGAKVNQVVGNNSYTSNITFSGTEDLGGGSSANFRYEIDPVATLTAGSPNGTPASADNSNVSNVGNGYSFVGLKSASAGEIQFGTINTATLDANGIGQPFGTAIGSGYKVAAIAATRYQQTLAYFTPSMNGFSGRYTYGFKDDKQNNGAASGVSGTTGSMPLSGRDEIAEFSLKYSQGPVNLIYANLTTKSYSILGGNGTTANTCATAPPTALASTATVSSMIDGGVGNACSDGVAYKVATMAGNYTVGNLTGYLWTQTQKADGQTGANAAATSSSAALSAVNRKASGLALKYQVDGNLSVQVGTRSITRNASEAYNSSWGTGNVASGGIGKTSTISAVGLDYLLSKRTAVYLRHEAIKDDAILSNTQGAALGSGYTTGTGTGKITNSAIGVRHTF